MLPYDMIIQHILCHDVLVNICYRCANIRYVWIIDMLWYVMLAALYNNMCYVMTDYIAAGCYVNCVLGYGNICYGNILHVLPCTFLHEENIQKQTGIQDIQPSTRPRITISQVPAGKWYISVCLMFLRFSRSFLCVFCLHVFCSIVNAKA